MTRTEYLRLLESGIGDRHLVYFGTRGTDAATLLGIRQFDRIFSQVSPLKSVDVKETCLESLTGERVDLDQYNIDDDRRPEADDMRQILLEALQEPAVVMAYRSCAFLASAWFPRSQWAIFCGVFHERQASFEHKPWVETELRKRGVRTLGWEYFADVAVALIRERLERSGGVPLVIRANRSDGGAGIRLVHDAFGLEAAWPEHSDGFLAICKYLEESVPLNVNACVFPQGQVSLHPASLQLIGLPCCTTRRFGYCGNDFAAFASLPPEVIAEFDAMTMAVGQWLAENNYLGAFGIDALLHRGQVYLTEINARFQGSTLVASLIDEALDRPDMYHEHLAAHLGLPPCDDATLRQLAGDAPAYAHVVCHNTEQSPLSATGASPDALQLRCRQIPRPGISVRPGAITFEAVVESQVTEDGLSLFPPVERDVKAVQDALYSESAARAPQEATGT
jgi:uncharacterized protein YozE (UPF0346 family)